MEIILLIIIAVQTIFNIKFLSREMRHKQAKDKLKNIEAAINQKDQELQDRRIKIRMLEELYTTKQLKLEEKYLNAEQDFLKQQDTISNEIKINKNINNELIQQIKVGEERNKNLKENEINLTD